jgi:hypothetical protein
VLVSFAGAFYRCEHALAAVSGPAGVDGYYYLLQVRSLLEGQGFVHRDFPLAFAWLALGALVFGLVDGIKIATAAASACAVVPMFFLAHRLTGRTAAGVLAAVCVASSSGLLNLAAGWNKQALGVTLALGTAAVAASGLDTRGRRTGALLLLIACALCHATALGLVLVFAAPVWVLTLPPRRRVAVLGAGLALAVALVVRVRLLAGLFRGRSCLGEHIVAEVGLGFLAALALVIGWFLIRRGRAIGEPLGAQAWLIGPLASALVLPWLRCENDVALAVRLEVMGFVPMALAVAVAAAWLVRRLGTPLASAALLLAAAAIAYALPPFWTARPPIAPPPVAECASLLRDVPAEALIIADDRAIAFAIEYETHRSTRVTEPRRIDPALTYRLVTGLPDPRAFTEFQRRVPEGLRPPRRCRFAVVFEERTWRAYLESLTAEKRAAAALWPVR